MPSLDSRVAEADKRGQGWKRGGGRTEGVDLEARLSDHLLGLLVGRALEADDERDRKLELLGRLDDALGDDLVKDGIDDVVSLEKGQMKDRGKG